MRHDSQDWFSEFPAFKLESHTSQEANFRGIKTQKISQLHNLNKNTSIYAYVIVSTHNGGIDDGSSSGKAHTSKQIFILMVDHCTRKGG